MKAKLFKKVYVSFAIFCFLFVKILAQDAPPLSSVSPTSAMPGDSNVTVTFTMNSGEQLPPDEVLPTAATIGTLSGTSVTRVDSTTVTAVFTFPADTATGTFDAVVTMPGPESDVYFTLTNGFTIGDGTIDPGTTYEALSHGTYTIVDTFQTISYNNSSAINGPSTGEDFFGQDAQYAGVSGNYTVSNDGLTVYDNNTSLTWTQSVDLNDDGVVDVNDKLTLTESATYVATMNSNSFGGYSDWRVPSIKELYSLMDFRGGDPSSYMGNDSSELTPFIDTTAFETGFGDTVNGERLIDGQMLSSTSSVHNVMGGQAANYGVNFVDGRIKGYPTESKGFYVYFCRGNTDYGVNDFVDNGDDTITDNATGLMWTQNDSGSGMDWQTALTWVATKNSETYLGYSDWRLPNAKELESIVDYSRSPDTTSSPAIDPIFNTTSITNEAQETDYPYFWSGTTHADYSGNGTTAAYVPFGRALGYMEDFGGWVDVHGAGCQRSDPKEGDPDDYPTGHGPQGDAIRIYNYVRMVRSTTEETTNAATEWTFDIVASNADVDNLQIGINPDATSGIDEDYDIFAPPVSFEGMATVGIDTPDYTQNLQTDIRNTTDGEEWQIAIDTIGVSEDVVLSWDTDSVPECGLYIWQQNALNGTLISGTLLDMSAVSSLTCPVDDAVRYYVISATAPLEIIVENDDITIAEDGTATINVKLSRDPEASYVIAATINDDLGISLTSATSVTIDSSNWDDWQTFTIAAGEDNDTDDDVTTISIGEESLTSVSVTVTEEDDDITLTVVADENGTTSVSGAIILDTNDGDMPYTITATADEGYGFTGWSETADGAVADPSSATTTVTTLVDTTVTANFGQSLTITSMSPGTMSGTDTDGTVTSTIILNEGDTKKFTVSSNNDSSTYTWTYDGYTIGNGAELSFNAGYGTVVHPDMTSGAKTLTCTITSGEYTATATWESFIIYDIDREPSAPVISLSNTTPTTFDDITVSIDQDSVDPDGDEIIEYDIEWTNALARTTISGDTLSGEDTIKGVMWQVSVKPVLAPYGEEEGTYTSSAAVSRAYVTIANTVPTAVSQNLLATPTTDSIEVQLEAIDQDVIENVDILSFNLSSYNPNYPSTNLGEISLFDSDAGTFTYTAGDSDGVDTIGFAADDGTDTSDEGTVNILVYDGWLLNLTSTAGTTETQMQLGVTSSASDAIDTDIDVTMESSSVCLTIWNDDTLLQRDMRASAEGREWLLLVSADTADTVINWDTSEIPTAGLTLCELSNTNMEELTDTEIDMSVTSEFTVTQGETKIFRITQAPTTFNLNLIAGWNMVSLPISPVDSAVSAVFSSDNIINNTRLVEEEPATTVGPVWGWNSTGNFEGVYTEAETISACKGYWVYSTSAVTIQVTGYKSTNTYPEFSSGWNLIGVSESMQLKDVPDCMHNGWGWSWENKKYVLISAEDYLETGKAYWLFNLEEEVDTSALY